MFENSVNLSVRPSVHLSLGIEAIHVDRKQLSILALCTVGNSENFCEMIGAMGEVNNIVMLAYST